MEASIQAVSPELICELRMTDGSVAEAAAGAAAGVAPGAAAGATAAAASGAGAGADVAAGAEVASAGGSAHAKGTDSASRASRNDRDDVIIEHLPWRTCGPKLRWRRARRCGYARLARRSEEHKSELQSQSNLVCSLL